MHGIRIKGNQIWRPIIPIPVLQTWGIRTQLHDIGIAFRAQEIYTFSDGGQEAWVEDMDICRIREIVYSRGSVNLEDGVFADEDSHIGVIRCFLPIIIEIEPIDEECGFFVVMSVLHRTSRNVDCVIGILIVSCADICDIRIGSLETVIEVLEPEGIVLPKPVFIANFHKFDVERLWVAVFGTFTTPVSVSGSHTELELVQRFFEERVHGGVCGSSRCKLQAHFPLPWILSTQGIP
jgi:hypothetical protein